MELQDSALAGQCSQSCDNKGKGSVHACPVFLTKCILPLQVKKISNAESLLAINQFAVTNQLTEASTQHLLDLILLHCTYSDDCIKTVYKLRKHYQVTYQKIAQTV